MSAPQYKEKQRKYSNDWHHKNKEKSLAMINANKKVRKQRLKDWLDKLKSTLSCEECGENHPATLDFHHLDPSKKEFRISQAISNTPALHRLEEEIKKCKVLCANCHRKLHHNERLDGDVGIEPT